MSVLNRKDQYGWLNIVLHWLIALVVIGLFASGLWIVGLDYYSPWYKTGPDLHRSFGVLVVLSMVLRLLLRFATPTPQALGTRQWELLSAKAVHVFFYLAIFAMGISGYLITTASGQGVDVFGVVTLPSLYQFEGNMEDDAGDVHEWLAWTIIVMALLHAGAALKHHYIDRDQTLLRMLGLNQRSK